MHGTSGLFRVCGLVLTIVLTAGFVPAGSASAASKERVIKDDGGVAVRVPPPGYGVLVVALTQTGHQVLSVETRRDGEVLARHTGPEPGAATATANEATNGMTTETSAEAGAGTGGARLPGRRLERPRRQRARHPCLVLQPGAPADRGQQEGRQAGGRPRPRQLLPPVQRLRPCPRLRRPRRDISGHYLAPGEHPPGRHLRVARRTQRGLVRRPGPARRHRDHLRVVPGRRDRRVGHRVGHVGKALDNPARTQVHPVHGHPERDGSRDRAHVRLGASVREPPGALDELDHHVLLDGVPDPRVRRHARTARQVRVAVTLAATVKLVAEETADRRAHASA